MAYLCLNTSPPSISSTPPTSARFLDALRPHAARDIAFTYDGQQIRSGYHVTEIKAATYHALDCRGNPESWAEVILQLWDVEDKQEEPTMTVGKFLSIYEKAACPPPAGSLVTGGLRVRSSLRCCRALYCVYPEQPPHDDGPVIVALSAIPASCKPQDRWQEAERSRLGHMRCSQLLLI